MEQSPYLHDILTEALGSPHVYFSPPSGTQLHYPCIVYSLEDILHDNANNKVYIRTYRYSVTVIDEDPDSKVMARVDNLPYCAPNRIYTKDNLNHFVFTLFFKGKRIKEEEING